MSVPKMLEAPPNVYNMMRARGSRDFPKLEIIPMPSVADPAFVAAYEHSYGSLYRRLLRMWGIRCSDGLALGEAAALTQYLLVRHRKVETFIYSADIPCPANPLLVNCESVQKLISHWFHKSDHCFFASNGLMYPTEQAFAEFGPGGFPANSIVAEHMRLRQAEHITIHSNPGDPMDGAEISDRLQTVAPEQLFRGQQGKWPPLAPFVRPLVDARPEESIRRDKMQFFASDWLFQNADHSLLATVNYALSLASGLCQHYPERTSNMILPTPYNLLWRFGPWDSEAVIRLCEDVFDYSICLNSATWGSTAEMAIFISQMTDYAYPVPVHAAVQFVTDFVPNPLVSTTTDIMRALLYASNYFKDFKDKFDVDWDRVENLIQCGTGYVLLVRIPVDGPGRRKVVPISEIARHLPAPYRSIGALESEYGVPGSIRQSEIREWKEASQVLSRLKSTGIWRELRREPGSIEPDRIANVVFGA